MQKNIEDIYHGRLSVSEQTYLWQPSLTAGQPDTLLGRPVYTSSYMPAIAAGNKTILFGDLGYYWVADRQGRSFKRLNELYRIPAGRLDCGSQKRGHRAADGGYRNRAHLRRTAAHGGRD